jgi:hypothetical protein
MSELRHSAVLLQGAICVACACTNSKGKRGVEVEKESHESRRDGVG